MVTRKFKQKAADVTLPGVRLIGLFLYVHAPLHGTFPHPGFTVVQFCVCMCGMHSLFVLGDLGP